MSGPDRNDARPYLVTAWLARALTFGAIGAGIAAWARWGPLAGLVAGALAVWLARAAKAPMPDDLRNKFD